MNIFNRVFLFKRSLENEVILAVVLLYVLLSTSLLIVHYAQPDDVITQTSSPSPSHENFYMNVPQPAKTAKTE